MSSHRIILTLATGLMAASLTSAAMAQDPCRCRHECCEPRIKFLDDLLLFGRVPSYRDPFEERIETERHDFTQSTKTVGRHVGQIELGYTYFYKDFEEEIEQAHTTPELLFRFGLTDDVEFRVRWNYAWNFVDEAVNGEGGEDLRYGFKLAVTEQCDWVPESALEVRFTAPTGGSAFTTEHFEFGLDYIYGWEFCEGWSLTGATQFGTNGLGDFGLIPEEPSADRFMLWGQSVAIGTELSDRNTIYNEVYGLFSYALADNYRIVIYNAGIDHYVTDNFVLDFRVGIGLTPDSDDLFAGFGGGYRF
jgi:hypothetical protein